MYGGPSPGAGQSKRSFRGSENEQLAQLLRFAAVAAILAIDLQAAILAALRKCNGKTVAGAGAPARWSLMA